MPEEHGITIIENTAGNSALLLYRTSGFLAAGLDSCTILLSIEVESSSLSARAVFLPQPDPCHQDESLHDDLIIESTAFRLLLHPIHSLFLRPFHPKRVYFVHPHRSVWRKRAILIGILLVYLRFGSFIFP